ncbi:F-box protein SKIP5 [Chlorella vulgaris]
MQRAPQLCDLDDNLLVLCFSHLTPLPDLFSIAASCRRFRDLALDRRTWLYVYGTHAAAPLTTTPSRPPRRHERTPPPDRQPSSLPRTGSAMTGEAGTDGHHHWYREHFSSLAAAVAASRPGDTILLEAGAAPHLLPAPVVIHHPVHILGGGITAEGCLLEGPLGLEALIDFRASGRLANLTLRSTSGACVAHTRGRLTVQGCTLECDARGLPHLVAPLLTRAVSWQQPPLTSAAAPSASSTQPAAPSAGPAATPTAAPAVAAVLLAGRKRPAPCALIDAGAAAAKAGGTCTADDVPGGEGVRAWRHAAEAAAGAGVLSVVETRVKARGSAVELRGSGRLSQVRAIYSYGHALVWLEVDSADTLARGGATGGGSSSGAHAAAWQAPAEAGCSSFQAPETPLPVTPLPSWAARAASSGFDAAAFQRRAQRLAGVRPAAPTAAGQGEQQAGEDGSHSSSSSRMEQKAEQWCQQHHAALVPVPVAVPEVAAAAPRAPPPPPDR